MADDDVMMAGTAAQVAELERDRPEVDGDALAERAAELAEDGAYDGLVQRVRSAYSEPIYDADEVKLLANGQISMMMNGRTFLLRSPNMGQIRAYRGALVDIGKRIAEAAEQQKADAAATDGKGGLVKLVEDLIQDGSTDQLNADLLGLMRQIVGDLDVAGRKLPADDDCPVWLPQVHLIARFIQHWRAVPLVPGR